MSDLLAQAATIANKHLDPRSAATWLDLVRPAVALDEASPGEVVVARLGGQPHLPAGTPWPVWHGVGPLSFVGEVDLAALSATGHDPGVSLPATGRLAFFVLDDPDDDGFADAAHLDSFHVLYVSTDGLPVTAAPAGTRTYAERELTGRPTLTAPDAFHPILPVTFGVDADADYRAWLDHPVNSADFVDAMERLRGHLPRHQVGGWAIAVQGPVELEAAHDEVRRRRSADSGLTGPHRPGQDTIAAETDQWVLVFQVDSDNDLMWGDAGTLYWLARPEDLARGDFTNIRFVMQCC
ncbi:YwqG family protein [Promicromonospora sp. NPDC050249]|uniref:YwqG family protein n=1 Tax=Promicromonospora sp. NPDC050249 TaxID=3154743 RepID=UPI0033F698D2